MGKTTISGESLSYDESAGMQSYPSSLGTIVLKVGLVTFAYLLILISHCWWTLMHHDRSSVHVVQINYRENFSWSVVHDR